MFSNYINKDLHFYDITSLVKSLYSLVEIREMHFKVKAATIFLADRKCGKHILMGQVHNFTIK